MLDLRGDYFGCLFYLVFLLIVREESIDLLISENNENSEIINDYK